MKFLLSLLFLFLFPVTCNLSTAYAVVNPLQSPNNKFGIHIIQATPSESSPAATLLNSSGGDWGYVTVLIESKDRDERKWQQFFDDLRRRHLIPIVRLATKPVGENWERPYEKEYEAWADFLNNLNWPIKNRYVTIYNEPNHGREWGGTADPVSYTQVLNSTIDALKTKSPDFFVLNAGFDASAPQKPPDYMDEVTYIQAMEEAVPGIFEKLDGWVSHSYPNPGFVGSPDDTGRGTVRGWFWELQLLRNLGVKKNLPVFITETGWRHSEGKKLDPSLPSLETVAQNYKQAFLGPWVSSRIVAVTPFLLTYQAEPFDHFSFKRYAGEGQNTRILGAQFPEYYPMYEEIVNLPKVKGQPVFENKAELNKGEIYSSLVADETYTIPLTFKNTGQSIWGDGQVVKLVATTGAKELGIEPVEVTDKVEPGQEYTFNLKVKAPHSGKYEVALNLVNGGKEFDNPPFKFTTEVKAPVFIKVKGGLKWKDDPSGNYLLSIKGSVGETIKQLRLEKDGASGDIEAKYLLPDYRFDFTLERPFYFPKTISQAVKPGVNFLDFGELDPDILSALLKPRDLWNLLPLSR